MTRPLRNPIWTVRRYLSGSIQLRPFHSQSNVTTVGPGYRSSISRSMSMALGSAMTAWSHFGGFISSPSMRLRIHSRSRRKNLSHFGPYRTCSRLNVGNTVNRHSSIESGLINAPCTSSHRYVGPTTCLRGSAPKHTTISGSVSSSSSRNIRFPQFTSAAVYFFGAWCVAYVNLQARICSGFHPAFFRHSKRNWPVRPLYGLRVQTSLSSGTLSTKTTFAGTGPVPLRHLRPSTSENGSRNHPGPSSLFFGLRTLSTRLSPS